MTSQKKESSRPLVAPVRKKFITDSYGLTQENHRTELWLESSNLVVNVPSPSDASAKVFDTDEDIDGTEDLGRAEEDPQEPYLIVGFDMEYTSPVLTKAQVVEGEHTPVQIHSYQFSACTHDGIEWNGIFLPDGDQRFALAEFMLFVYANGVKAHANRQIPTKVFLVGHNVKLTLPLFTDFEAFSQRLSIIQGTLATGPRAIDVELPFTDGGRVTLKVKVRDTLLLVSQASKRIKDVARLVGLEEVQLTPNPKDYVVALEGLSQLRSTDWDLFRRYALNDAEVCVRYLQRIIRITFEATKKFTVPVTLASIGIRLLRAHWEAANEKRPDCEKLSEDDLLGVETVTSRVFDSRFGHLVTKSVVVRKELLHLYEGLITECYHGGRFEQYWFGPSYEAEWSDYDLSSAYPTSMSYIGLPDWNGLRHSYDLDDYTLNQLGFALVDFEFPRSVRFPTLPVRAEDGLIFPRRGRSYCAAPEIQLALRLGARLEIVTGVVIPQDLNKPVFSDFVQECITKRDQAGDGTFDAAFWKEIANTIYGKTAQGLKERRIYDMKDRASKPMPRSLITNAAYAAYVTSFTRAVLGSTINAVPDHRYVFSCSTDGFLTDATQSEMDHINAKKLFNLVFGGLREYVSGNSAVMKKKHGVRQLIGWKARGQATLIQGESQDWKRIVLAKASIYTVPEMDTTYAQNDYIVSIFLNRNSKTLISEIGSTSIKKLAEYGGDPRAVHSYKRLNMEYDWKSKPTAVCLTEINGHVAFSTEPWDTVDEYNRVQVVWDKYQGNGRNCIKSVADMNLWINYLRLHTISDSEVSKNWSKADDPEIERLRIMLCRAFNEGAAGVIFERKVTAKMFAEMLVNAGIPCKQHQINNGLKKEYKPRQCIPSDAVIAALHKLKVSIPTLVDSDILYPIAEDVNVIDLRNIRKYDFL